MAEFDCVTGHRHGYKSGKADRQWFREHSLEMHPQRFKSRLDECNNKSGKLAHRVTKRRFLIRMNEMLESLNIINQIINKLVKIKPNKINKNDFSEINSPHYITKFLAKNKQHFNFRILFY